MGRRAGVASGLEKTVRRVRRVRMAGRAARGATPKKGVDRVDRVYIGGGVWSGDVKDQAQCRTVLMGAWDKASR